MEHHRKLLTESQSKEILTRYNIDVTQGKETATVDAAIDAAREIGLPVVLKVSHPELGHKTDIDGVALNIQSYAEIGKVAERLFAIRPQAKVRVEKYAETGGIDLILGFKHDPVFGPVVMLGMGGIFAEIFNQTPSLYVGELNEKEAFNMIGRLKGRAILEGARGRAPLDINALAGTLTALSKISIDHPEIVEMDINPWRIYERGGTALDALAVVETNGSKKIGKAHKLDHGKVHERIHNFFNPESTAVVGASTTAERAGNIIIKNLKTFCYNGDIYPVNPSGKLIEGLPSYTDITKCPKPPDLVIFAVPYHQVEKVMEDVAKAGTRHVIVASGGFSDAGEDGRQREARLVGFCREHNIRLMGPNSIGTIDAKFGFCTSIGKLQPMKSTGISVFGQSGNLSTGFSLKETTEHGRGFSKVACIGNKADVNETDFLEYLAGDPDTKSIGIYIESVKDGQRFIKAAELAAGKKPVVVLKSGNTELGAQAAASHTGSLTGTDAVYDAVFRQTGIQRVSYFNDLFNVLRGFDLCPLPKGNKVGIVSITGAGCVLAADACSANGMEIAPISEYTRKRLKELVPEWVHITNPADIWSTIEQRGSFEAYQKMCKIMLDDDNVDILLIISSVIEEGVFDTAAALGPVRASNPDKPILACHFGGHKDHIETYQRGLESVGIPVYGRLEAAVQVASYLYQRKGLEKI